MAATAPQAQAQQVSGPAEERQERSTSSTATVVLHAEEPPTTSASSNERKQLQHDATDAESCHISPDRAPTPLPKRAAESRDQSFQINVWSAEGRLEVNITWHRFDLSNFKRPKLLNAGPALSPISARSPTFKARQFLPPALRQHVPYELPYLAHRIDDLAFTVKRPELPTRRSAGPPPQIEKHRPANISFIYLKQTYITPSRRYEEPAKGRWASLTARLA